MSGWESPDGKKVILMKNKTLQILFVLLILAVAGGAFAQTVIITFTGRDVNSKWVQLDSVTASNLTRGWTETLYWPDTVLEMHVTSGNGNENGIATLQNDNGSMLQLAQNNPNPFKGTTYVSLYSAETGAVSLEITDVNGRVVEALRATALSTGTNHFRITLPNAGFYFLTARQNGNKSMIKMVCNGGGGSNSIEYLGTVAESDNTAIQNSTKDAKSPKLATTNPFQYGDIMEYTGYATVDDTDYESERIVQMQGTSQTLPLYFDVDAYENGGNGNGDDPNYIPWDSTGLNPNDAKPCPGTPTLTDIDGNIYNTVQIGTQCWMKENLRVTRYANGTSLPFANGQLSSNLHCYAYPNDDSSTISTYGLLYNPPAMMHLSNNSDLNPSGVQGICPDGWHLPSKAEFEQLSSYLASQSVYLCGTGVNDVGKSLAEKAVWKNTSGSCTPGNDQNTNNASGFSGMPAGYFFEGKYMGFKEYARYGSSNSFYNSSETHLVYFELECGSTFCKCSSLPLNVYGKFCSVRCVKD